MLVSAGADINVTKHDDDEKGHLEGMLGHNEVDDLLKANTETGEPPEAAARNEHDNIEHERQEGDAARR